MPPDAMLGRHFPMLLYAAHPVSFRNQQLFIMKLCHDLANELYY